MVVPDITITGVFQNDYTVPGFERTSYNLNATVPVPLFDRNQGNIKSAVAKARFMSQQNYVKTNELTNQLVDAYERFQSARYNAEMSITEILPNQVRAYQGIFERYVSETSDDGASADVAFGDIVVAQQNLSSGVSAYVTYLLQQWVALTDIANLLQLRDFKELLTSAFTLPNDTGNIIPSPAPQEGAGP
jgi:cobalt-zinc-cadmium efflux system outer membrane protein